jgi:hypothetical protein
MMRYDKNIWNDNEKYTWQIKDALNMWCVTERKIYIIYTRNI